MIGCIPRSGSCTVHTAWSTHFSYRGQCFRTDFKLPECHVRKRTCPLDCQPAIVPPLATCDRQRTAAAAARRGYIAVHRQCMETGEPDNCIAWDRDGVSVEACWRKLAKMNITLQLSLSLSVPDGQVHWIRSCYKVRLAEVPFLSVSGVSCFSLGASCAQQV